MMEEKRKKKLNISKTILNQKFGAKPDVSPPGAVSPIGGGGI